MEDNLDELYKQHFNNYKNSINNIIENNTNRLIDEDIHSLFKKPPLDSMDSIKSKIISIGKKYKIIVKIDILEDRLNNYRSSVIEIFTKIKKKRIDYYSKIINNNKEETLKIKKKECNIIDKDIRKMLKDRVSDSFNKYFIDDFQSFFKDYLEEDIIVKIEKDISSYFKNSYLRLLMENIDIKIMVKDTIMMNTIKESTERYLFTLDNSRILNDFSDKN